MARDAGAGRVGRSGVAFWLGRSLGSRCLLSYSASILITSAFLLTSRPVAAMCDTPVIAAAPAPHSRVPPNPTIYLFFPYARLASSHERWHVTVVGDQVDASITTVSDSGAIEVRRVEVRTRGAIDFRIQVEAPDLRDASLSEFAYRVDPAWRTAHTGHGVSVLDPKRSKFYWTCSGENVVAFRPSVEAPVYRVEWADTAEKYAAGARDYAYFPHDPACLWRSRSSDESASPRNALIKIGYVNCLGYNLPQQAERAPKLEEARFVGVAAVFPDGTVVPASTVPFDTHTLPDVESKEWLPFAESAPEHAAWMSNLHRVGTALLAAAVMLGCGVGFLELLIAIQRRLKKQFGSSARR